MFRLAGLDLHSHNPTVPLVIYTYIYSQIPVIRLHSSSLHVIRMPWHAARQPDRCGWPVCLFFSRLNLSDTCAGNPGKS